MVFAETELGSPREVALPGLPRIRTCGFPASGSSVHGFARRGRCGVAGVAAAGAGSAPAADSRGPRTSASGSSGD